MAPSALTKGMVVYKNGDATNPENCMPFCGLPHLYTTLLHNAIHLTLRQARSVPEKRRVETDMSVAAIDFLKGIRLNTT